MGSLGQILQRRSPVVHTLSPDQAVSDAVSVMATHEVGAVLVVEKGRLIGVFSERDFCVASPREGARQRRRCCVRS